MDSVRSGPFGQIFRPDNFIFGQVYPMLAALSSPGHLVPREQMMGSSHCLAHMN